MGWEWDPYCWSYFPAGVDEAWVWFPCVVDGFVAIVLLLSCVPHRWVCKHCCTSPYKNNRLFVSYNIRGKGMLGIMIIWWSWNQIICQSILSFWMLSHLHREKVTQSKRILDKGPKHGQPLWFLLQWVVLVSEFLQSSQSCDRIGKPLQFVVVEHEFL